MNCPCCGAKCIRHETGNETGMQFTPYRCTQCDWDEEFDIPERDEEWFKKAKLKKP